MTNPSTWSFRGDLQNKDMETSIKIRYFGRVFLFFLFFFFFVRASLEVLGFLGFFLLGLAWKCWFFLLFFC